LPRYSCDGFGSPNLRRQRPGPHRSKRRRVIANSTGPNNRRRNVSHRQRDTATTHVDDNTVGEGRAVRRTSSDIKVRLVRP
jgi:hypothetical protein